jgi:hypothetical protein
MTYNPLYDEVFRDLRPWYATAVAEADSSILSAEGESSPARLIIVAVLHAYLRSLVNLSDEDRLLETAFEKVPASHLSHAYWTVFRGWSDTQQEPPNEVVRRLVAFWKWRLDILLTAGDLDRVVEEAKSLGWLMKTPFIPDSDRIDLGLRTLQLSNGESAILGEWSDLDRLADLDPVRVYEMTELLLSAKLRSKYVRVRVAEVKPVLEKLLAHIGEDQQARAIRLINKLGEHGMEEFGELLHGSKEPPPESSNGKTVRT